MENQQNIKEQPEIIPVIEVLKKPRGRPRKNKDKHSKDPEQAKEYQKQYYAKNKDKLLTDLKQKVVCELCGSSISKCNLYSHQKSSKCKVSCYDNNCTKLDKLIDKYKKLSNKQKKLTVKDTLIDSQLKQIYFQIKEI
eukprot:gene15560-21012_t